jgi:hypothetical protein
MISRLNHKNSIDVYEFVQRTPDSFEDFYITENRGRKFIKDLKTINRILKRQEIYGLIDKELKAIMIIYKEKGFRSYLKILSNKIDYTYDLLKFVNWNFYKKELFIKIKKSNPLFNILRLTNKLGKPRYGFEFLGSRGSEILLIKKVNTKQEKSNGHYFNKD